MKILKWLLGSKRFCIMFHVSHDVGVHQHWHCLECNVERFVSLEDFTAGPN